MLTKMKCKIIHKRIRIPGYSLIESPKTRFITKCHLFKIPKEEKMQDRWRYVNCEECLARKKPNRVLSSEMNENEKIKKFMKKPVIITAVQWTGNNLKEVIKLTGVHSSARHWNFEKLENVVKTCGLKIFILEGHLNASIGDWIIKGVQGECYPIKNDIFKSTYEELKKLKEGGMEKVNMRQEHHFGLPPIPYCWPNEASVIADLIIDNIEKLEKINGFNFPWQREKMSIRNGKYYSVSFSFIHEMGESNLKTLIKDHFLRHPITDLEAFSISWVATTQKN